MQQDKTVHLIYRYRGLRSYIDLDLCAECPRADRKGCCGHYSPVFYLLDLAFLYREDPALIELLFSMPSLTILDYSVTVNKIPDESGFICPMLDKASGCRLEQMQRESICRHFICCGVPWRSEAALEKWATFFDALNDYEITLNDQWSELLAQRGLSLRNTRDREIIYELVRDYLDDLLACPPDLIAGGPRDESYTLPITIDLDREWIL